MADQKLGSVENVTCPFCGLACDDLTLQTDSRLKIESESSLPEFCQNHYRLASLEAVPDCHISNQKTTLEEAAAKAGALLKAARAPLFSGLAVDVNGARAALKMADFQHGIIAHINNPYSLVNTKVMREEGWIGATLSEVHNRAELIVVFGTKPFSSFPRLAERLTASQKNGRFRKRGPEFALVGAWKESPIPAEIEQCPYHIIATEPSELEARIRELGQIALSSRPNTQLNSDTPMGRLLKRLYDSAYSAFTWTASEFEEPYPEVTLQLLSKVIKQINTKTRCVAMPLTGTRGDITFHQVCGWQSGCPSATSFAKGFPEHDPEAYDADRLLAERQVDLLVWISSLDTTPPPQTDIPTIVIGHPAMQAPEADVYIPVAVPGIDHGGHVFRTDSVVSLPLKPVRDSGLQSVPKILDQVWEHIN